MVLDYEDTYMAWKEDELSRLERLNPKSGAQVQDISLHDTDESQLTERERLIMIMSVVVYEVDHNLLTKEIRGELGYYHRMLKEGRLDGLLADNEKDVVIADIEKYHTMVFGS